LIAVKRGLAERAYFERRLPEITVTQPAPQPPGADAPIAAFSKCHEGILSRLDALAGLPSLLEAAERARTVAAQTVAFFRDVVYEHHQEEERELFPAVLASAQAGAERQRVQDIVDRLTREHREVEAAFVRLEPALKNAAKGHGSRLDAHDVSALVARYEAHARFEEQEFLPLSQQILGRNSDHMAALGLSMHLRHSVPEVLARYGSRI
jgi:hemerythrin-like domain-containing protein